MESLIRILLLLGVAVVHISARPTDKTCPREEKFVYEAVKCCKLFADFAYQTPTLKQICSAYKQAKPCMDKLLYHCPYPPPFKHNEMYINWLQVSEIEAYCWY